MVRIQFQCHDCKQTIHVLGMNFVRARERLVRRHGWLYTGSEKATQRTSDPVYCPTCRTAHGRTLATAHRQA